MVEDMPLEEQAGQSILKHTYRSPRWTQELMDCSMPMTLDTYSLCSYNCQYCFAFFQKVHNITGMKEHHQKLECVRVESIKALFDEALKTDNPTGFFKGLSNRQFIPYIRARKVMQWGALTDPFDFYEKRHGITLELLRYFDSIDYPLSFSTKSDWFAHDDRYRALFAKHKHNWHFKVSIITMNEQKAKEIERGAPTPRARISTIRELASLGIHVTLRLRPYMIGASEDWKTTIKAAHDAGADSVSTEYFCLEGRADEPVKARYALMSKTLGYDLLDFYKRNSPQPGYKRLTREIKRPVFDAMAKYTHSLGMRFHVSDAFCREMNDACNCCGVPPEWNSQTSHFGGAILLAKAKGQVSFKDIQKDLETYFPFIYHVGVGYNDGTNQTAAQYQYASMTDFIHHQWNQYKGWRGPCKPYGHVLIPIGRDKDGDVIYQYHDH